MFEILDSTPSHFSFKIFGIRFNFLKQPLKNERAKLTEYYSSFENASDIPKAEGELRLLQEANAGFLKLFDDICQKHQIKYWIDFGTLLGAVRHKGFIPWDDDIDIAMLREDYERFIELFSNGFDEHPELDLFFSNNKINKCFIKLRHKGSKNLCIDIFPYDYYHSKLSKEEKKELSEKITKKEKARPFKTFKSVEKIREHFNNVTMNDILENKKVDVSVKPDIFMAVDFPHSWKNKVYSFDDIFPLKQIDFEGMQFFAPNKPENILESIYGAYMTIPKNSYPRHTNYLNISTDERKVLEGFIK